MEALKQALQSSWGTTIQSNQLDHQTTGLRFHQPMSYLIESICELLHGSNVNDICQERFPLFGNILQKEISLKNTAEHLQLEVKPVISGFSHYE